LDGRVRNRADHGSSDPLGEHGDVRRTRARDRTKDAVLPRHDCARSSRLMPGNALRGTYPRRDSRRPVQPRGGHYFNLVSCEVQRRIPVREKGETSI
jgi:hypothetical protein